MSYNLSGICAAAMLALLLSGGCSRVAEDESALQEARESEAEQREALRRALDGGTEESAAIKLVKTARAAQGEGTMEQWLQQEATTNGSSIFFPRWEVDRRGVGKYEVVFTCTLMQEDGRVGKWGVAWAVDIVVKTVGAPRQMKPAELNARASRYFRDRRRGLPPEPLNLD
jgi:hypothetical protein